MTSFISTGNRLDIFKDVAVVGFRRGGINYAYAFYTSQVWSIDETVQEILGDLYDERVQESDCGDEVAQPALDFLEGVRAELSRLN